jgi:hypothetical protein
MGGSSPKGKLGENVSAFSPSAIPDANESLAYQSKAIRGNKTMNKTGFASRTWIETPGSMARRLALRKRSEPALNY